MRNSHSPNKADLIMVEEDTAPAIDWITIEGEYLTGQLSLRIITKVWNVSHAAKRKKARAKCWTRDLTRQVGNQVVSSLVETPVDGEVDSRNARVAVNYAAIRAVEVIRQNRNMTMPRQNEWSKSSNARSRETAQPSACQPYDLMVRQTGLRFRF